MTGRPCPGTTFHRRPGGESWFTSLPQRCLIAASTSKPNSKSKSKNKNKNKNKKKTFCLYLCFSFDFDLLSGN
ncbi:hypothetical protein [Pseudomonas graminis]